MTILELIIKIVAGIVIGFIIYKIGLLNDKANSMLSRLVVEVTCPFMIFANIASLSGQSIVDKQTAYLALLIGVIIYVVMVPLCHLTVKLLRVNRNSRGMFECLLLFGNVGFLGIPVAESLYGAEGIFYMALLNIHFLLLLYTYGLWQITKDSDSTYKFSLKRMINPSMISILVSLVIFLLDIKMPEMILAPFDFFGGLTSPLSLVILGSSIAAHDLKKLFLQGKLYALTAVKMLLFPAIAYVILKATVGPGVLTSTLTFYVGMPSAVITSMFAMAYGGDQETAAAGTAMMNIFCIITIPLTFLMINYL